MRLQFPLVGNVKSRQLKFWLKLVDDAAKDPSCYMAKLINLATEKKIPYIRYYKSLAESYANGKTCKANLRQQFFTKWSDRIDQCSADDNESKLGVYKQINPELQHYTTDQPIPEFERVHITRYRTGSHNLKIEKGRHSRIPRENRLCMCNNDVQTLSHVIFSCPLTNRIQNISNLIEFFAQNSHDITTHIQQFAKILKIKIN